MVSKLLRLIHKVSLAKFKWIKQVMQNDENDVFRMLKLCFPAFKTSQFWGFFFHQSVLKVKKVVIFLDKRKEK